MLWLLLILISSNLQAKDVGDTVHVLLKSHRDVYVCGSNDEKRIQVSLDLGNITPQDSLYSFDVLLTYNPNKIKFMSGLYINTLSEFFDFKGFNVQDTGSVRAYGAMLSNSAVYGNRPLIAFEAKYLGDCADTMQINLLDMEIEVSNKLQSILDYKDKKIVIEAKIKNAESNIIETRFLQDTVNYEDEDSLTSQIANINTFALGNVNSLGMEIVLENNINFNIEEISSLSEKVEIDSLMTFKDDNETGFKFKLNLKDNIDDENVLLVKTRRLKQENDTTLMKIKITGINDCSCATKFKNDSLILLSNKKKDTTGTGSVDYKIENNEFNINAFYSSFENRFIIKNLKYGVDEIRMYNIFGSLIKIDRINSDKRMIMIKADNLEYGIYLFSIRFLNGLQKKIVLIKN